MSSFNVVYNIIAQDKFSAAARRINSKIKSLSASVKRMARSFKNAGKSMSDFGKSMILRVTVPLAIMGGVALRQSAKLETLKVSLESMTGSAEKAGVLMKDLVKFTATTPFKLEGVGSATKTLLAFKVAQEKIIPTLRMLGDISAGTGAPLEDMAKIFGKVKAKGKMMTEELLQFAERGIPIIDVLAEGFGVAKSKIFEMASKSQISFEVMQKALAKTTAKGGVFYGQTIKQSKTLAGVYSTLADNAGLAMGQIGDQMVKLFNLKGKMAALSAVIENAAASFTKFAEANPFIMKTVLVLIGLIALGAPLLIMIGAIASALPFLVAGFSAIAAAVGLISWPVLAVVAAFGAALWIGSKIADWLKSMPKLWNGLGAVVYALINPIDTVVALFDKMMNYDFSNILGDIGSMLGFGSAEINATSQSKSTVDVNINAPAGVVKSVKSRRRGSTRLRVGQNMVTE